MTLALWPGSPHQESAAWLAAKFKAEARHIVLSQPGPGF
jgi:hypothetical protein